jgi:hypothetical protein
MGEPAAFPPAGSPLLAAVDVMRGFPGLWAVAGGWAIDLFLGRQTREHADVDLCVFRDDAARLHRWLHGWELRTIVSGRPEPWREGEPLPSGVHELWATRDPAEPRRLELLVDGRRGDRWIFRRDHAVTRPMSRVVMRGAAGIPFLAPEIVLLYKAGQRREHDAVDLAAAGGELDAEARRWLVDALVRAEPGHQWIRQLDR